MKTELQYKMEAIVSLVNDSSLGFSVDANGITGLPKNKTPTDAEIETKIKELKAEFESLKYQRDRQYPTWQEQMDAQYWDQVNGTTTWKDHVKSVKDANPKE